VAQRAVRHSDDTFLIEEQAFFEAHRFEWLREHEGQLALIKGRELFGFYDTVKEAFEAGLALFGYQEMAIVDVLEKDPVSFIRP
jgi:hypothetical protein